MKVAVSLQELRLETLEDGKRCIQKPNPTLTASINDPFLLLAGS